MTDQFVPSDINVETLLDIPQLTGLFQMFSDITGMVTALLDLKGKVLIATNWQMACTQFHRIHADTAKNCLESDTIIASALDEGESYKLYKCKNGLVDVATPVVVQGQHIANIFTGQFYLSPPDLEAVRQKAQRLGFDEEAYIGAIKKVPIYSEEEIRLKLEFLEKISKMVGETAAANLKLQRANDSIQTYNNSIEQSYRHFFSVCPVGIAKNDMETGEFVEINPALSHFTGYDFHEIKRLSYWELTPERYAREEEQALRDLTDKGQYGPYYKHYIHKDGHEYPVLLHGVKVREGDGRDYIWSVIQDVSDQKALEETLRNEKKKAEQANQSKTDFLTNMSHEIRTPMSGIAMALSLALSKSQEPEVQELLETAEQSTNSLHRIVNDILDFSKMDSGKLTLTSQPLSLEKSLHIIENLQRPVAEDKGLVFSLTLQDALPDQVLLDGVRFQQVVNNLINNAIKFTQQGTIDLRVGYQEEGADKGWLRVGVKDSGAGIPLSKQDKIFERFEQIDSRNFDKGTGLGLAIAKQIIELMQGQIGLISDGKTGSEFYFTIPVETVAQSVNGQDQKTEAPTLSGRKILIAEDVKLNQMLLQRLLEANQCQVVAVDNGKLAVEALADPDHGFDLVLMDNQMPEMNGIDAVRAIRSLEGSGKRIPIIAVTADAFEEQQQAFFAAGMDGFVAKPIKGDILLSEMQRVLI